MEVNGGNMSKKKYKKDFLADMYRTMVLVRRFDERVHKFFQLGKIEGTAHLSVGEEATQVGACKALEERDYITSTHRGHGHMLAKGADTARTLAELFYRETGYCGGKGGSMHVADVSLGILGANGIVGAGIPIATGSALTAKLRGTDEVTVCFFGDAASNQGVFHECMNMAAAWKLPVVFVCENNGYGVSVKIKNVTNTENLSVRASAYNIPGITIDGNDVLLVYETVKKAVADVRAGKGPSMIECLTFRHSGHNSADTAWYRPDSYMEEANKKDAIARFGKVLLASGFTKKEIEALEEGVEKELDAAVEFSEGSKLPPLEAAFTDVYSEDNERCVIR